jgi:hypothetical protein
LRTSLCGYPTGQSIIQAVLRCQSIWRGPLNSGADKRSIFTAPKSTYEHGLGHLQGRFIFAYDLP